VSSATLTLNRNCKKCSRDLAPDALVCDRCHTLTHAEELEQLSAGAKALENAGENRKAREAWLKTLEFLPPDSRQAEWVRDHARRLESLPAVASASDARSKWMQKLGPLAPIAVALAKGKVLLSLVSLKFVISLAAFMGVYWALFGLKFGIGFAVLILIHEMGHFIDVKRRGLPADMPVFLPGLGAYVRWRAMGVSGEARAAISLAGPFAGWLAAVACALVWWKTGAPIWAALARASAWLNVLNLIPVSILDGGQAILPLSKAERIVLMSACIALWLLLGESVFFLVAAGATWKLFTKDLPPKPSPAITGYFVGVLASLGFLMWLMPGKGFGAP
jgi:Zn-dependent protease